LQPISTGILAAEDNNYQLADTYGGRRLHWCAGVRVLYVERIFSFCGMLCSGCQNSMWKSLKVRTCLKLNENVLAALRSVVTANLLRTICELKFLPANEIRTETKIILKTKIALIYTLTMILNRCTKAKWTSSTFLRPGRE